LVAYFAGSGVQKQMADELPDPEPPGDWTLPHGTPSKPVWEVDEETGELVDRAHTCASGVFVLSWSYQPLRPEPALPPPGPVAPDPGKRLFFYTSRGRACGPKGMGSRTSRQLPEMWTWEGAPCWYPVATHPPLLPDAIRDAVPDEEEEEEEV
jgi:hypothetical protein